MDNCVSVMTEILHLYKFTISCYWQQAWTTFFLFILRLLTHCNLFYIDCFVLQILLLTEAIGSRACVQLEVENALSTIADRCR